MRTNSLGKNLFQQALGRITIFTGKATKFIWILMLALSATASTVQASSDSYYYIYFHPNWVAGGLQNCAPFPAPGSYGPFMNFGAGNFMVPYTGQTPAEAMKQSGAMLNAAMGTRSCSDSIFNYTVSNFRWQPNCDGEYLNGCIAADVISVTRLEGWKYTYTGAAYYTDGYMLVNLAPPPPPKSYSITIQGDSSVEPWNKLSDPKHSNSNVPFTAVVMNNNGPLPAGIKVTVTSDVTTNSGGHNHTSGRPKGKLAATATSITTAPSTFQGFADSNGVLTFVFGAEEASGEHTITATCDGCQAPANAKVDVLIPALGRLGDDGTCNQFFCLVGGKAWHPDNHYYTTAAMNQIVMLAYIFSSKDGFGEPLKINDSSLKKGGRFDIHQDWTFPHKGHRTGVVVDINNFSEPDPYFEDMAAKFHIDASHWEDSPPHYHLWLLGRNE
jgi:hypothetical protein